MWMKKSSRLKVVLRTENNNCSQLGEVLRQQDFFYISQSD